MAAAAGTDRAVIDTVGDALEGTGKPFLIASGVIGVVEGRPATENDRPDAGIHPRVANAAATLALADRGVRAAAVRFAPTVHGRGDYGFMSVLVDIARRAGVSGYPGDGSNRWPAVHVLDAAALLRLVVEQAAPGSIWHATAEEGVATKEIAEAIGRATDLPVKSVPADQFEWLSGFFAMDLPITSEVTRRTLGWKPTHPGLLEDLNAGAYTS
jgi:nucleoside-diphosphate-sugar epimerase